MWRRFVVAMSVFMVSSGLAYGAGVGHLDSINFSESPGTDVLVSVTICGSVGALLKDEYFTIARAKGFYQVKITPQLLVELQSVAASDPRTQVCGGGVLAREVRNPQFMVALLQNLVETP